MEPQGFERTREERRGKRNGSAGTRTEAGTKEDTLARGGARYTLRSIVRHAGRTPYSGHYTADVRLPASATDSLKYKATRAGAGASAVASTLSSPSPSKKEQDQGTWMRFDDRLVTEISAAQAMLAGGSQESYMFFYILEED